MATIASLILILSFEVKTMIRQQRTHLLIFYLCLRLFDGFTNLQEPTIQRFSQAHDYLLREKYNLLHNELEEDPVTGFQRKHLTWSGTKLPFEYSSNQREYGPVPLLGSTVGSSLRPPLVQVAYHAEKPRKDAESNKNWAQ